MFGYRQNSILAFAGSDGVIKLTSQLHDAGQEQAQSMRGYDEDHVSILNNAAVILSTSPN
jgi:hypothetical protein